MKKFKLFLEDFKKPGLDLKKVESEFGPLPRIGKEIVLPKIRIKPQETPPDDKSSSSEPKRSGRTTYHTNESGSHKLSSREVQKVYRMRKAKVHDYHISSSVFGEPNTNALRSIVDKDDLKNNHRTYHPPHSEKSDKPKFKYKKVRDK
jgi:hypothetical protein